MYTPQWTSTGSRRAVHGNELQMKLQLHRPAVHRTSCLIARCFQQALIAARGNIDYCGMEETQTRTEYKIGYDLLTACARFRSSFVLAGSSMIRRLLFTSPSSRPTALSAIVPSERPGAIIIRTQTKWKLMQINLYASAVMDK